jgi:hypothetical protein
MKRVALVLLSLALVRCADRVTEPLPAQSSARTASIPAASRFDLTGPMPRPQRAYRNLFAYYEPPAVIAPPVFTPTPPPVTVVEPSPAPPAVEIPPPPQFPYPYNGPFGPDEHPIAAFVRDGEVRTVRAGERIDDQFTLRTIGIESVEVEARGWEQLMTIGMSSAL